MDPEVVLIALLLAAAIAAGVLALRLPPGQGRAQWSFIGSALIGGLFCFVGVWNLIGIQTAKHVVVTGVIGGLEQHGGRSASSDFHVTPVSGLAVKVHSGYSGSRLQEGDNVTVEELTFHRTLLRLEVLGGRNAGWVLTEGNGTTSSAIALVLGAILIVGARVHHLRNPVG